MRSDLVRVDRVFPPVVGDAVGFAGVFGEVGEPPEVMGAHVATAPVFGGHGFASVGEGGVGEPVVAVAGDGGGVAPVVVFDAVGGVVHPAALGGAGVLLFILGEELPHVLLFAAALVELGHDRFGPVAEVFQHAIDAAFHVEAH